MKHIVKLTKTSDNQIKYLFKLTKNVQSLTKSALEKS